MGGERVGLGFAVGADVAFLLLLEYLVDGEEYACLLDIAKFVVDSGAKHFHRGRQAHVGVDHGRNVVAVGAYGCVEYLVVLFE